MIEKETLNGPIDIIKIISGLPQENHGSKIGHWVNTKETAILTTLRKFLTNFTDKTLMDIEPEKRYTHSQNKARDANLTIKLVKLRYGVTGIVSAYIGDDKKEVREENLFVVNLNDDPAFKNNINILPKL